MGLGYLGLGYGGVRVRVRLGCGVVMAQRLQQLVTETLAEAVEDAEQQGEGYQADQDHPQPQLTNHQQVDPQGEGAEVHLQTNNRYQPCWFISLPSLSMLL